MWIKYESNYFTSKFAEYQKITENLVNWLGLVFRLWNFLLQLKNHQNIQWAHGHMSHLILGCFKRTFLDLLLILLVLPNIFHMKETSCSHTNCCSSLRGRKGCTISNAKNVGVPHMLQCAFIYGKEACGVWQVLVFGNDWCWALWRTDMQHLVLHEKWQEKRNFYMLIHYILTRERTTASACILPLYWEVLVMLYDLVQIALTLECTGICTITQQWHYWIKLYLKIGTMNRKFENHL